MAIFDVFSNTCVHLSGKWFDMGVLLITQFKYTNRNRSAIFQAAKLGSDLEKNQTLSPVIFILGGFWLIQMLTLLQE